MSVNCDHLYGDLHWWDSSDGTRETGPDPRQDGLFDAGRRERGDGGESPESRPGLSSLTYWLGR